MRPLPQSSRTPAGRHWPVLLLGALLAGLPVASADLVDASPVQLPPGAPHPVRLPDGLDDKVDVGEPGIIVVSEPFPHERCRWTGPNAYKCQTSICFVSTPSFTLLCYHFEPHETCVLDGPCVASPDKLADVTDWVFGEALWCLPESLPGCW